MSSDTVITFAQADAIRKALGWSQKQVTDAIGVSERQWSNWSETNALRRPNALAIEAVVLRGVAAGQLPPHVLRHAPHLETLLSDTRHTIAARARQLLGIGDQHGRI